MLISKKIRLPLHEKFKIFIESRIANCYVSNEGNLINVYSPSELINKELLNKGIDYRNKSIDAIRLEIRLKNTSVLNIQNRGYLEELWILEDYLLELSFYLHDYNYNKMSPILKNEFKNLRQYSVLLRKNKFSF